MNAKKHAKQITNILIFLLLISCCSTVQAAKINHQQPAPQKTLPYKLKTITDFPKKLLEQTTKEDLWIFDIDDTLVESIDLPEQKRFMTVTTAAQHTELMRAVKRLAREARSKFWTSFHANYAYQPVEQRLIEIIKSLQKRGIRVIALTSRATEQHKITYDLLKKYVDLDFSSSFINKIFELNSSEGAAFYNGILFTNYNDTKGELLTEFLKKIKKEENFDPSHIYFFDDRRFHAESVIKSMDTYDKPCLSFYYTAALHKQRTDKEASVNSKIVEHQYELMKKWTTYVSYQEATELYSTLDHIMLSVLEKDETLQEE